MKIKKIYLPKGEEHTKKYLFFWRTILVLFFIYIFAIANFNKSILADNSAISIVELEKDHLENIKLNEGLYEINLKDDYKKTILLKSHKLGLFKIRSIYQENSDFDKISYKVFKGNKDITKKSKQVLLKGSELTIVIEKTENIGIEEYKLDIRYLNIENIIYLLIFMILWLLILEYSYKRNQASVTLVIFFLFLLSLTAEKITFKHINLDIFIAYSIFYIVMIFFINQFIVSKKRLNSILHNTLILFTALIIVLLSIVPLVSVLYKVVFGTSLLSDELYAIFQTNTSEGLEFLSDFVSFGVLSLFVFVIIILFYAIWWHRKSDIKTEDKLSNYIVLILSLIILSSYFDKLRLPNFIDEAYAKYQNELAIFRETENKREANSISFNAKKSEKGETYIVVIGESLNKNHMEIYEYERNTTPNLKKLLDANEIIKFNNAYSNHVQTMPSLSFALTEANQYNDKNYFNSLSIVEIFKKSGFETVWLTNQSILGEWDNLVSIIAHKADKLVTLNKAIGNNVKTSNFDGDLLPLIKDELDIKTENNRVIFVHLMGSHSGYENRYPKEFNNFKEGFYNTYIDSLFNDKKRIQIRQNYYDNSVLYNDYVVSNIIELLKKENSVSSLIYFSDHGEDVLRRLGHNPSTFTFDMTQIPLIAYFSPQYQDSYLLKIEALKNNKDKIFSNDLIYDTLVGLTSIKTDNYNESFDLSSEKYNLDEDEALVLHGKMKYKNRDNQFFK